MKVIKKDFTKNHYRVVERFPLFPKRVFLNQINRRKWMFFVRYYELQLDSYWGKGWLPMEQSLLPHSWDFKWDESYLSLHKQDPEVVKYFQPRYKNSTG